jgi:hypothetical protein
MCRLTPSLQWENQWDHCYDPNNIHPILGFIPAGAPSPAGGAVYLGNQWGYRKNRR